MAKSIPARKDVPASDKWNLSSIYKSDQEWEENLKLIPDFSKKVLEFKGKLGSSPENLLSALKAMEKADLQVETVYHYASLQHEADEDVRIHARRRRRGARGKPHGNRAAPRADGRSARGGLSQIGQIAR